MSNWTEEQQEEYEQGNDGGYTPPKGSLDWAEQPAQPEPAPKGTEAWTEQNSGGNAPEPSESKKSPKTDVAPPADKPADVAPPADKSADVASPADKPADVAPQGNADAVIGMDKQIELLQEAAKRYEPETDEDRKKRERRERSKKIVSAVSDGLQALSNLYFTSRGAPNMYNHKEASQLTPLQAQLEKARAERQANADRYLQYSLKIGDLQNERAKTLRELEAEQERRKLAREKAQREQEAHGWLRDLQEDKKREQKGKATIAEEEAKNAPEMQKAKLRAEKNRGASYAASARRSNALAREHELDARGRFEWYDQDGTRHYAKTRDEAIEKARQHGTLDSVTVDTTDSTESDVLYRGKVTGEKKKTKKTTSKKVVYPGIRTKSSVSKSTSKSATTSGGGGKYGGFSIH